MKNIDFFDLDTGDEPLWEEPEFYVFVNTLCSLDHDKTEITCCPVFSVLFPLLDELSFGNLPKHIQFNDYGHFTPKTFYATIHNLTLLIGKYQFYTEHPDFAQNKRIPQLSEKSMQEQKLLYERYNTDINICRMFMEYHPMMFEMELWKYLSKHYTFENGSFKRYKKII